MVLIRSANGACPTTSSIGWKDDSEGTLTSGQRLPAERVLAEQFGVSRPSLREAIQKLVAKGLLVSRQGGGNFVAESLGSTFSDPLLQLLEHSAEAQRDLLEFRHTLEASCAYYAAQRATQPDRARLKAAFDALQDCYARADEVTWRRKARPMRASTWRLPRLAIMPCCCTPFGACSTCSSATW